MRHRINLFVPLLNLLQDPVGSFLVFPLIRMAGLFDKNQFVFFCRGHMGVQVPQEIGRIPVLGSVDIVQQAGKLPVPCRVGDAFHPSHEGEREHPVTSAGLHLLPDDLLFSFCYAGHHVGQVGRREQKEIGTFRRNIIPVSS